MGNHAYCCTISADSNNRINELLKMGRMDTPLIVYGENACDESIGPKYRQLMDLGFSAVHIYPMECSNGFCCKTFMAMRRFQLQNKSSILKFKKMKLVDAY